MVPDRSILVLVDPQARAIEVITGTEVRRTLSDASVGLDEGLRVSVAWHLEMRERDAGSRKAAVGAA